MDVNVISTSGNTTPKEVLGQKFTTSNFTETVVVASDSVFGSGGSSKPPSNVPVVKKRKLEPSKSNASNNDELMRYVHWNNYSCQKSFFFDAYITYSTHVIDPAHMRTHTHASMRMHVCTLN